MKKTAQEWNLERDVVYNHKVVGANWEASRGQWLVLVEHDGEVFETQADVLISAQGFLK
jgi:cation diffusion facilitator CzcD-associated flavoprotein CzcO